jgi:hypothetical protein
MSVNAEKLTRALQLHSDWLCDDCLAALSHVQPRQTVRAWSMAADSQGFLSRDRYATCSRCHSSKISSRLKQQDPTRQITSEPEPARSSSVGVVASTNDSGRVWYWEGNVQHAVVTWLRGRGWDIASAANTATKAAGVDIVARLNERELWVTVKGFPELRTGKVTNPATQARHWFSHAMTDVIDYRGKRRDVEIAMALPGPFPTYDGWVRRVAWLIPVVPFWVFVVGCSGRVCPDREFP